MKQEIKKLLFICFTKSHYLMAKEIVHELNQLNNIKPETYIICSGYIYNDKDNITNEKLFSKYYFVYEHPSYFNKLKFIELRKLIFKVTNIAKMIMPEIIMTFSDNPPLYQNLFYKMKNKSKIVLFHEGYGDYSDVNITFKGFLAFLFQKITIFPYPFKIITRSYTDYYNYSFLLYPELIKRDHQFKKYKISKNFMKNVYSSKSVTSVLDEKSIFLCLSAKDWLSSKLQNYFEKVLTDLNKLPFNTYMKIAPHQSYESYKKILDKYIKINLIDDNENTSETYCLDKRFDFIITDESSAVINALFIGLNKGVYFLNKEIETNGFYKYDKNDLIKHLSEEGSIKQIGIEDVCREIKLNKSNFNCINMNENIKSISDNIMEILND